MKGSGRGGLLVWRKVGSKTLSLGFGIRIRIQKSSGVYRVKICYQT